jgi:hypothetical protein
MTNLDDYLSTPDELFNTNAQHWYFKFSGTKKPNTEKSFEVFVKALHEVYFFIQENLNKPFGCIDKIKNVSKTSDFNELEKLVLVDKILNILIHHPDQNKQSKVFIQLVDFRHNLSPYTDDPEIQNPNWHFDFEAIKEKLQTIETATEKQKYLMNLLFDYSAKAYEIDELERQYYESIGFAQWIKTELGRCKYEQTFETATTTPKTKQAFQLRKKQGTKTDLIRILNAVYEMKYFEMADGQIPSKEIFMKQSGEFFGINLSKYDTDLSQALNNTSLEANLKVFEEMKSVTQKNHYISKTEK